jgi:MinD-like ATPase involved in chromosome partitioning or flagellar assembly/ActR/RegA family two-component response regulator
MANVLIIDDNEMFCDLLSQMVVDLGHQVSCALTLAEGLKEATASEFEVIFLDVFLPDGNGLEILPRLRQLPAAPEVIIITGAGNQDGADLAMKNGAWDYVEKQSSIKQMILPLIRAVKYQEEKKSRRRLQNTCQVKQGKILGFIGAKGGVGTTTVALNVAAVLAQQKPKVIAVELQAGRGTFSLMLNQNPEANLQGLLQLDPESLAAPDLERFLYKSSSGLQVLFGPQKPEDFKAIDPQRAMTLIKKLAELAEYVVLDLPAYPAEALQAVISCCSQVVLVTERQQFSVQTGKTLLESCRLWGMNGALKGAIITNRIILPMAMKIENIKSHLGCKIIGIVPYSVEACSMSQISGQPIALFQPTNIAALSLIEITNKLASQGV